MLRRTRTTLAIAAAALVLPFLPALPDGTEAADGSPCPAAAPIRAFDITAIAVDIVYDKYGDHDPQGLMYILTEDRLAVLNDIENNKGKPAPKVQPLVIRANKGDCVRVAFTNSTSRKASIHPHGVEYNVVTSDGAFVGRNPDTQAAPGQTVAYEWYAANEGPRFFHDHGTLAGSEADGGTNVHGLWGALMVEEPGTTWTNPETGAPLRSGLMADIHHPTKPDFREYSVFFQDEIEIEDDIGNDPTDPNGSVEGTLGFSYRAEPWRNRFKAKCPDCVGEETILSSWAYGDPATHVLRAYRGDPAKIRLIHTGPKETHVFHLHAHQWRHEPDDPDSTIIDSQTISPRSAHTIEILFGAGSKPQTAGDSLFHCHLYPHFAQGMWSLWRVQDRLEDGSNTYPDGAPVPALRPLPDRDPPPAPDEMHPGYPRFMPGVAGRMAPRPPLGVVGGRGSAPNGDPAEPTALEAANMAEDAKPGAPFVEPCPPGAPQRNYEAVAIQKRLEYNEEGWHDPKGRLIILKEDEAAVLAGTKEAEPLAFRANAGECVNFSLTNHAPPTAGGDAFQQLQPTVMIGQHIHLVKFDVLASDGASNGWNYLQAVYQNETLRERWYADTELKTIFTHDHLVPALWQHRGHFGAMVVEPAGSSWTDPETGLSINSGNKAIIHVPGTNPDGSGNDFREFVLQYGDFAPLLDKDGRPLNPPPTPEPFPDDDPGVMSINYRNEPLLFRSDSAKGHDPAYAFSSRVHGDPATPLLEAYPSDPVRIRHTQGAMEEQHSFNLMGHRWPHEPDDPGSTVQNSQTIGISEAFNYYLDGGAGGPLSKAGDYLYYSGAVDDLWLGMWGIFRVHPGQVTHVRPLPDRKAPPEGGSAPEPTGLPPARAAAPGEPCPAGAPIKTYDVAAFRKNIAYNNKGDHDPNGLMFALAEHEAAVLSGARDAEPLVIRANQGDCIELTLTNHLPEILPEHQEGALPPLTQTTAAGGLTPVTIDTADPAAPRIVQLGDPLPTSNRVGLTPNMVLFDPQGSSGATVGFNPDQTVGPGESITYRWYADKELGGTHFSDLADVVKHRHHGLWGGLVIEPEGSTYHDCKDGSPTKASACAIIAPPGQPDFREQTLFFQDGLSVVGADGQPPTRHEHAPAAGEPPHVEEGPSDLREHLNPSDPLDPEDQGQKGVNYRSEPFSRRLGSQVPGSELALIPDISGIFSSALHGDPATPLIDAYVGDPLRIRLLQPSDKPRNQAFELHGHVWRHEPGDPDSALISTQGGVTVGRAFDIIPVGGAGGPQGLPGDYLYESAGLFFHLSGGQWGIMRVHQLREENVAPLADRPAPPEKPRPPSTTTTTEASVTTTTTTPASVTTTTQAAGVVEQAAAPAPLAARPAESKPVKTLQLSRITATPGFFFKKGQKSKLARITFHLDRPSKVTLEIFSFRGRERLLIKNTSYPAGSSVIAWNGKDDFGKVLPTGNYRFLLRAVAGGVQRTYSGVVRWQSKVRYASFFGSARPGKSEIAASGLITGLKVRPDLFRPAPTKGKPKLLSIEFQVIWPAICSLRILDRSGKLMKTIFFSRTLAPGVRRAAWDGSGFKGKPLKPGDYRVVAVGAAPLIRTTVTVPLRITKP